MVDVAVFLRRCLSTAHLCLHSLPCENFLLMDVVNSYSSYVPTAVNGESGNVVHLCHHRHPVLVVHLMSVHLRISMLDSTS